MGLFQARALNIGLTRLALVVSLAVFPLAQANAAADGSSKAADASYTPKPVPATITQLIEEEQFSEAVEELQAFVRTEKRNPDAWNWLGFSQRKSGDLNGSLKSYKKALKLDKRHLGANEYLGELYLMRGDLRKARKQLRRLARYCGKCEQYEMLKQSIKDYKDS